MSLYFYYITPHIQEATEVFMHSGTGDKKRFVPIHTIAKKFGTEISSIIPAIHVTGGCGTTLSNHSIGKYKACSKRLQYRKHLQDMTNLGENIEDTHFINVARVFILLLHGLKMNQTTLEMTLDDLRFRLASVSDKASAKLPPTENTFLQHTLWCKIQHQIWLNSNGPKPSS